MHQGQPLTAGTGHDESAPTGRGGRSEGDERVRRGLAWLEAAMAVAAFAVLCVLVLSVAPRLVEPDDYAYRGSIVAVTEGHFLTLSSTQVAALAQALGGPGGRGAVFGPGPAAPGPGGGRIVGGPSLIPQWVQLSDGRWISEKDPGYPFLAAPFQALGIIRWAPLFYGALACVGLFAGARRWLGRFGGAAAVGLYCSSGAALLFAWRDYMPTFTDASLIAAGSGALLWAVLAVEASSRWRTWAGLAGFVMLEAATFVRYTDVVVLGCAAVAVVLVWWRRAARLPLSAVVWWLASVAIFGVGVAVFDDLVYGGPLTTGYRPGEIQFGLGAIAPNLRYMPAHLLQAMPMLVLGLVSLAWIIVRWVRLRRAAGEPGFVARRDLWVGLALAASWFAVWGLYSAYFWTANAFGTTLQFARFYVPALGAISLLGAWLVTRIPGRAWVAGLTSATVIAAMFGLGAWSYHTMTGTGIGLGVKGCVGQQPASGPQPAGIRCPAGPQKITDGPGGVAPQPTANLGNLRAIRSGRVAADIACEILHKASPRGRLTHCVEAGDAETRACRRRGG
jgi:hypothetical protein